MSSDRTIHPHFQYYLDFKDKGLIELYTGLRQYILSIYPDANELIYHTHALVSVYSLSDRLSEAFCMIPIYSKHLNLGFHKGTLLDDKAELLNGTGKLIRHIPVSNKNDYRNKEVKVIISNAIEFELNNMDCKRKKDRLTINKIKISK